MRHATSVPLNFFMGLSGNGEVRRFKLLLSILPQFERLNRIKRRSNGNLNAYFVPRTVLVDEITASDLMKSVKTFLIILCAILPFSHVISEEPLMRIEESSERITMKRGEKTIFHYNKKPTAEAANHAAHYSRSGYIHPLFSPSGLVITGDYAEDHPHQHGLFFAWTKTTFEGRKPEFWNQKLESGRISYQKPLSKENGAKRCSFVVEHLFEDLTAPGGPKPVIKETWEVTGTDQGEEAFLFDIKSTQTLIGENPLTIEKYHYGGMAIRGTTQWLPENKESAAPGIIQTGKGLDREQGNHSRPDQVTMHGPIDNGHAGVTIINDPENFRSPQWVRLHPSKPYFVFAPMVDEAFQITKSKPYVSRFRYLVFDGPPDEDLNRSHRFAP